MTDQVDESRIHYQRMLKILCEQPHKSAGLIIELMRSCLFLKGYLSRHQIGQEAIEASCIESTLNELREFLKVSATWPVDLAAVSDWIFYSKEGQKQGRKRHGKRGGVPDPTGRRS